MFDKNQLSKLKGNKSTDKTPSFKNSFEDRNISQFGKSKQEEVDKRIECMVCGRKFNQDRIEKHEISCAKSSKERK